jgi:hypothetical protein
MMGEPSIFKMTRRAEALAKNTARFCLNQTGECRAAVVETSTIMLRKLDS